MIKYPKTYHLPFSPSVNSDDKIQHDLSHLESCNIIITEKRDGENTTMYNNYIHARSLDSNNHPSRNFVKGIHGRIKHLISNDVRICGENLYAKHSIHYTNLFDYFEVFNIWRENLCLSWNETIKICDDLNLYTVPILYSGKYDKKIILEIINKLDLTNQEGIVIRNSNEFLFEDFSKNVVKYVRKNHIQTNEHWMNSKIEKNILLENSEEL